MARNSVFFLIAAIVISFFLLPSALAGPACARRNWQAVNCVQACKNKWGWPGKTMGTDPWGAVMKSGPNNMNSVVTQACGSTTRYVMVIIVLWVLTLYLIIYVQHRSWYCTFDHFV